MTFGIAVVVSLLVAVAVHELGHLLVARSLGMRVQEFFIGFGPRLWSLRVRGVAVGVKAIPVGGYVKIPGMDLGGDGESAAGTYAARPWYAQVAVALAGPATHFLIAMVVLVATLGLASGDPFDGTAGVSAVSEGSPAAMAGLEPGDVVVEIDGVPVASWQQVRSAASQRTTPLVGVTRDGAFVELSVPDFRGVILPAKDPVPGSGPAAVVVAAASQVVDLTGLTVRGLISRPVDSFLPSGNQLVNTTCWGDVFIYDFEAILAGAESEAAVIRTIPAHNNFGAEPAISPDGLLLATSSTNEPTRLWEISSGRLLGEFGSAPVAGSPAFHPVEPWLLLVDGTRVRAHTLDIEELILIATSGLTRQMTGEECLQYLHAPCNR